ncbi:MAG TPA: PAS domain S-box protein [Deltaproteobacteria bacterium]|nr:PAS domain S-box protein [Deltaproteobacteria bacterium]HPR55093.1 PAS domain S-box protein [Deltaproteobacteria bacterium]HXK48458.1 PAS domain S-box protein [Deltaproteobacteria bacterium]
MSDERKKEQRPALNPSEASQDREAVLKSLLAATPAGVALLEDRTFIQVNSALCRITGYTEEEMVGMPTRILYPDEEEFLRIGRELYEQMRLEGLGVKESLIRRKDGTVIDVLLSLSPFDPKDPSLGVCATVLDITERKRAEKALRESEQKFRAIFNVSFGLIGLLAPDGTVLESNRTALEFAGVRMSDVVGKPVWETPWWSHSTDMQRRLREAVRKAAGGELVRFEATHPAADGTIHDFDFTLKPVKDDAGKVTMLIPEGREITERKRGEQSIRESEERYRAIFEHTGNASVLLAEDTTILLANSNFEKLSGYSKQEIEGKMSWTVTADREDVERMRRYHELRRKETGSAPESYEFRFHPRQGGTRDIILTIGMIPGTKVSIASLMDITERKQAEEALRKSEELYSRLVDTIPDVVVRTDLEGKILFVNDDTIKTSGYSREELIGRNMLMFVAPEEQDRAARDTSVMMEGRPGPYEYQLIMKDERKAPFELNGAVLKNEDGTPFGLVLVCRDISERKRSEERSRQSEEKFTKVFMTAPIGISITRMADGLIIDTNMGFEELTGWKREEVLGRTSLEVNFWADPADRACLVGELQAGRDVLQREFQFRHKDGTMRSGIYSARHIRIAGEENIIFSLQDITEQRRLENERHKLELQLFQSQKMEAIGQLAGGVAHDFNNMLSVIIGNTELAMDSADRSGPIHKILEEILNAGTRSADLTRQLLAFARKQTANPRVVDLNDMVSGMLKMLQRLIGEDITLAWVPGNRVWKVKIDPSQLDQILANLMVNARDAIETNGRIVIETSNEACDEKYCSAHPDCIPDEYAVLTVSDNGCGMETEVLTNIFEPFFTTKKEGQGTGLGLATVYGIVRQNGGFINVYSELGQGTTFKIHLPRYKSENLEEDYDREEEKAVEGGNETVLIVEDEEAVLKLSRIMLERLGYRVLAFRDPGEAIRYAGDNEETIDLLLTDMVMPDMNGKELSERIGSVKPGMKCLYMSGYTADVIARQGILEEGVHFLPKPFSLKDMASKVRETLDQ